MLAATACWRAVSSRTAASCAASAAAAPRLAVSATRRAAARSPLCAGPSWGGGDCRTSGLHAAPAALSKARCSCAAAAAFCRAPASSKLPRSDASPFGKGQPKCIEASISPAPAVPACCWVRGPEALPASDRSAPLPCGCSSMPRSALRSPVAPVCSARVGITTACCASSSAGPAACACAPRTPARASPSLSPLDALSRAPLPWLRRVCCRAACCGAAPSELHADPGRPVRAPRALSPL